MQTICEKCGKKITPIFSNHVYNGTEAINKGKESIMNGSENIRTGREKIIYDYICPFCGTKHKSGIAK